MAKSAPMDTAIAVIAAVPMLSQMFAQPMMPRLASVAVASGTRTSSPPVSERSARLASTKMIAATGAADGDGQAREARRRPGARARDQVRAEAGAVRARQGEDQRVLAIGVE